MLIGRKIMPLVVALFAISGWLHPASASQNTSSCSSVLVSTPLCDEFITQSCLNTVKEPETPQIQSSIIIASPKEQLIGASIQAQPETISTPTPLPDNQLSQIANLDSDKIFDLINQFRVSFGLTPFEREEGVCQLAQIRSTELSGELASRTLHSGLYNRNLPYWIWENAKVGSNEEETVAWWLASPVHHQSIVGDYKYSCVKCTGNTCSELFTSFVPK